MTRISTFAERLKAYIKENDNITYEELSKKTNIPAQTLNRYALGKRVPKVDQATDIALKLGVNPLWLQGFDVPEYLKENDEKEKTQNIDISNEINNVIDLMKQQEGLMFCGKPMDEKTKTLVKMALEHAINIAIEMDKKDKQNN